LGRGEGDKNGGRKKEKKEDKYRVSTGVSDREGGISFRRGRARGIWFWTDISLLRRDFWSRLKVVTVFFLLEVVTFSESETWKQ
jgi:hypothetical protein